MKNRIAHIAIAFALIIAMTVSTGVQTFAASSSDILGDALTELTDKSEAYGRSHLAELPNGANLVKAYDAIYAGNAAQAVEISLSSYGITESELETVFNAYYADSPEHFWVEHEYRLWTLGTKVTKIGTVYTMNKTDAKAAVSAFVTAVKGFVSSVDGTTDAEIALELHDLLAEHITYTEYTNAHNPYGALVDGKSVCEGYARAYTLLLNEFGIENTMISGSSKGEGHAWNAVKLGDSWVNVDVTWDDGMTEQYHYYFACTDDVLLEDHTPENPGYDIPVCTDSSYYLFTSVNTLDTLDYTKILGLFSENLLGGVAKCEIVYNGSETLKNWFSTNAAQFMHDLGIAGSVRFSYSVLANEYHLSIFNHKHEFSDWTIKTPATCTEDGSYGRTCSICNETEYKTIRAKGHTLAEKTTVAATLTEKGYDERKCSKCTYYEKTNYTDKLAKISGKIGTLSWELTNAGVMTISGEGVLPDYAAADKTPWGLYPGFIKEIHFGLGISAIGKNSFGAQSKIADIYFGGNSAEWNSIVINSGNDAIKAAELHCEGTESKLVSDTYEIGEAAGIGKVISGVADRTKVSELAAAFNGAVVVVDKNGTTLDGAKFAGTGSKVQIVVGGAVVDEAVVIVRGDATGDGIVSSADALSVLKASAGLSVLDKAFVAAGDINGNGSLSSVEALKILRYSAGLEASI